jgi:hypothetical protein
MLHLRTQPPTLFSLKNFQKLHFKKRKQKLSECLSLVFIPVVALSSPIVIHTLFLLSGKVTVTGKRRKIKYYPEHNTPVETHLHTHISAFLR